MMDYFLSAAVFKTTTVEGIIYSEQVRPGNISQTGNVDEDEGILHKCRYSLHETSHCKNCSRSILTFRLKTNCHTYKEQLI